VGFVQASWQVTNCQFRIDNSDGIDLEVGACIVRRSISEDPMVFNLLRSGPLVLWQIPWRRRQGSGT